MKKRDKKYSRGKILCKEPRVGRNLVPSTPGGFRNIQCGVPEGEGQEMRPREMQGHPVWCSRGRWAGKETGRPFRDVGALWSLFNQTDGYHTLLEVCLLLG